MSSTAPTLSLFYVVTNGHVGNKSYSRRNAASAAVNRVRKSHDAYMQAFEAGWRTNHIGPAPEMKVREVTFMAYSSTDHEVKPSKSKTRKEQ